MAIDRGKKHGSAEPGKGVMSQMRSMRKVTGCKPVIRVFMIGQLMPQTMVSKVPPRMRG